MKQGCGSEVWHAQRAAWRTLGAERQHGARHSDAQVADARGDVQAVVGARPFQRARLQHAVQQPHEAAVPPGAAHVPVIIAAVRGS